MELFRFLAWQVYKDAKELFKLDCLSASLMLSVNSLFLLALHELLKIAESDGRTACLYELRAYD